MQDRAGGLARFCQGHPFQFDKKGSGALCRGMDFYQRLVRLPKSGCPARSSPLILIDHAKAIATATGTSGWEAISRRGPGAAVRSELVLGVRW